MTNEDKIINNSLDRSEEILQILSDTFGENDRRVRWATSRYTEAISKGTPLAYRMAALYLEWAVAHPGRIGNDNYTKPCKCDHGWIKDETINKYRPCPKCLPGAHDRWASDFRDDGSLESESVF